MLELRGRDVAQGVVRAETIVVEAPRLDGVPGLGQAKESVFVEALVAEPSVEALDVGILVRLAGLDEVQLNALGIRPTVERAPDKLEAVVPAE